MIDGPIQRENLYDMDNKNKQDPNMKSNWQTITMLLIAALLTFGLVSWMNSYLNSKKRQELSYNEFVKMVDGGEVESIKIGGTEITVVPKKDNAKYSQDLDYYVVRCRGIISSWTVSWKIMWRHIRKTRMPIPFCWYSLIMRFHSCSCCSS